MATFASGKINDRSLWYLQAQVQEMNKKATKLGLEPLKVEIKGEEIVERKCDATCMVRRITLYTVEVTGEVPRINGWIVAAVVEFTEAGNFVTTAPGVENLDPKYRTIGNVCDHCNSKRNRNDLVVIRHEDGREMVVGRNCLADFIRSGDAESMLRAASFAGSLELVMSDSDEAERYCSGKRIEYQYDLREVLEYASICVRKLGWVPASKCAEWEMSTKDAVTSLMNPPFSREDRRDWEKWVEKHGLVRNEFDAEEADKAEEFLATIANDTPSDFLHQLRILRDLKAVPASKLGFAVSIIAAAKRHREEQVKFAERNKTAGPHVGTEGERLKKVPVTVTGSKSIEGDYGVKTVINFRTEEGSRLTWFATGDKTEEFRDGGEYLITFTVKKHEESDKYGRATVILRVKDETPQAAV